MGKKERNRTLTTVANAPFLEPGDSTSIKESQLFKLGDFECHTQIKIFIDLSADTFLAVNVHKVLTRWTDRLNKPTTFWRQLQQQQNIIPTQNVIN